MIVRDEATHLPSCLQSVAGVVSEQIIVDTGSVDETPAIAQQFGAIVHSFSWCDDFASARNAAIAYASGDWILVLDADEVLVPHCISSLQQAIRDPNALVIQLLRQELGAAQSPYSLLSRLFRRHPALTFNRPYHESIDDSVLALQVEEPHWQVLTVPEIAIQHFGYQTQQIRSRQKTERAERIMRQYWHNHPNDIYIASKLGALDLETGKLASGIAILEQAIQTQPNETAIAFELHYHLGIGYTKLGDRDRAATHYLAALNQPVLPQLKLSSYNNLGSLLHEEGNLSAAKAAFESALQIDPTLAISYYNLGLTCRAMGNVTDAIAHYQHAIQFDPDYADAYRNLGVALLKLGQVPESLAAFQHAIALYEQQDSPEAGSLRDGVQSLGLRLE
jgi:tetratricopeptide (TPR) repeat protein